jgi:hypothetical protein
MGYNYTKIKEAEDRIKSDYYLKHKSNQYYDFKESIKYILSFYHYDDFIDGYYELWTQFNFNSCSLHITQRNHQFYCQLIPNLVTKQTICSEFFCYMKIKP